MKKIVPIVIIALVVLGGLGAAARPNGNMAKVTIDPVESTDHVQSNTDDGYWLGPFGNRLQPFQRNYETMRVVPIASTSSQQGSSAKIEFLSGDGTRLPGPRIVTRGDTLVYSMDRGRTWTNPIERLDVITPAGDIPFWAEGDFEGVWGLTFLGFPLPPAGWVEGYYSSPGIGRFEGVFDIFSEPNATNFIDGVYLGPFMLGRVGSLITGNYTLFAGLGRANETYFYWRVMAILGPTFYMYGTYSKFEE